MAAVGGYVLVWRDIQESTAFRNFRELGAFLHMLRQASWKPTRVRYKDREISLQRGQLAMSVRDIVAASNGDMDRGYVERFLKRLENRDTIKTETATGVTIITICNYDKYQAPSIDTTTGPRHLSRHDRDTEQESPSLTFLTSFQPSSLPLPFLESPEGASPATSPVDPASLFPDHPIPEKPKPAEPAKPASKTARRRTIPEGFSLSPAMMATAARHGIVNGRVSDVFEAFVDYHAAKGTVMLSWERAWATWCRNDKRFAGGSSPYRGAATPKARTVGDLAAKVAVGGPADTSEITDYEGGKHHEPFVEKPRVVPLRHVGGAQSAISSFDGELRRATSVCEPARPLGASPNDVDDTKRAKGSMA